MNLLLTADSGFAPGLELTLASLLLHGSGNETWDIHILDCGIDEAEWKRMLDRFRGHPAVGACIRLQPQDDAWPGVNWSDPRRREPYRWIEALLQLPHLDKVIYLDSDLLLTRDLSELWHQPLRNSVLAAIPDVTKEIRFDCPDPQIRESEAGRQPYFNSGVMLIDLAAWRARGIHDQCLAFMRRWEPQCQYWDQTVVNAVLQGRFEPLNQAWNLFHEALGYLETPDDQRLPWEGYVWHLWRQYKPWIAFNPLESGALWYGLHEAWHGRQSPRYHTTRPGYRSTVAKMRHPRLAQWVHHLRGHREMADYWNTRAKGGTGRGDWAKRFASRIDEAAEWWRHRAGRLSGWQPTEPSGIPQRECGGPTNQPSHQ